mgnify:FL=1
MHSLAADAILTLHVAIVLFVVGLLPLILVGAWRDWRWVRLRWLRLLHLGLILFIAGQAWLGELCPLTTWEQDLRRLAGQDSYATSFIEHWLARLLYIEAPWWAFVLAYTTFAVVVAAAWVLVPPDSRRPA